MAFISHDQFEASHWSTPLGGGGGGEDFAAAAETKRVGGQKNAISPFGNASEKNICATIRIGQEILCLPYAGFFFLSSEFWDFFGAGATISTHQEIYFLPHARFFGAYACVTSSR